MNLEKVAYAGWPNCYRIESGDTELIVTSDVGPRVIRYGFKGGQNLFFEASEQLGKSGEQFWMMRGGHRLWIAPETPATYALDNHPVKVNASIESLALLQPVEAETSLQKELSIEVEPDGSLKLTHRIENRGPSPVRLAPWALTQMAAGGVAIAVFPSRESHHLQPTNPLAMWSYTDFSDPRWQFTKKFLILRHDPNAATNQKAGLFNENTVAAYLLGSDLFIKQSEASCHATYPDFGCSFETFANRDFLELETLGSLTDLLPDNSVSHIERWRLKRDVHASAFTDDELDPLLVS